MCKDRCHLMRRIHRRSHGVTVANRNTRDAVKCIDVAKHDRWRDIRPNASVPKRRAEFAMTSADSNAEPGRRANDRLKDNVSKLRRHGSLLKRETVPQHAKTFGGS